MLVPNPLPPLPLLYVSPPRPLLPCALAYLFSRSSVLATSRSPPPQNNSANFPFIFTSHQRSCCASSPFASYLPSLSSLPRPLSALAVCHSPSPLTISIRRSLLIRSFRTCPAPLLSLTCPPFPSPCAPLSLCTLAASPCAYSYPIHSFSHAFPLRPSFTLPYISPVVPFTLSLGSSTCQHIHTFVHIHLQVLFIHADSRYCNNRDTLRKIRSIDRSMHQGTAAAILFPICPPPASPTSHNVLLRFVLLLHVHLWHWIALPPSRTLSRMFLALWTAPRRDSFPFCRRCRFCSLSLPCTYFKLPSE